MCSASAVVAAAETKETTVPDLKTVSYWAAKPENDVWFLPLTVSFHVVTEATLILIILWCCY